ncbi:hypothetical protein Tco_0576679 [Tanacetum coccineum]
MESANPSCSTSNREFLDPKKKKEMESWLGHSRIVDSYDGPNEIEYFDTFPTLEELEYHDIQSGNTFSDPLEDLSKDLLASLAISPFHDDPYMKVMQAYNATNDELTIPSLRAPIAPLNILPPSLVLPPSPLFDPRYFFLPE